VHNAQSDFRGCIERSGKVAEFAIDLTENRLWLDGQKGAVILGAAEGCPAVVTEADISAKALTADRDDDRKPLYSGIQNELNRIFRQRQITVQDACDREALGVR
jgi:hypothetical protein